AIRGPVAPGEALTTVVSPLEVTGVGIPGMGVAVLRGDEEVVRAVVSAEDLRQDLAGSFVEPVGAFLRSGNVSVVLHGDSPPQSSVSVHNAGGEALFVRHGDVSGFALSPNH